MNHPEQIVSLAGAATQIEGRPADAAALLVDAAALLSIQAMMPVEELIQRLEKSYDELAYAESIAANMSSDNFKPS